MTYDLYIVFKDEAVQVWPISIAGAKAIREHIPEFTVCENLLIEMQPEEFQAMFPPPLIFLAQNPETGVVSQLSRKRLQ